MTLARSGVTATTSQLADMRQSIGAFSAPAGMGSLAVPYLYTGSMIDAAGVDTGNAIAPSWGTVPADAVGVEVWVNGNAADDYLFWATNSGVLSATGVLATNVAANVAANRHVASGQSAIIPFVTQGVVPATLRLAVGKTSVRYQARWISASSLNFPYRLSTNIAFGLTGAGASQLLPTSNATFFPAGYKAVQFQICGSGVARMTTDGTVPTATVGRILPTGTYLIDEDRMGVSLATVRLFLPTGTNAVGSALVMG